MLLTPCFFGRLFHCIILFPYAYACLNGSLDAADAHRRCRRRSTMLPEYDPYAYSACCAALRHLQLGIDLKGKVTRTLGAH